MKMRQQQIMKFYFEIVGTVAEEGQWLNLYDRVDFEKELQFRARVRFKGNLESSISEAVERTLRGRHVPVAMGVETTALGEGETIYYTRNATPLKS